MADQLIGLTVKQIHMMQHAWGYDSTQPGFRTHYCTQLDDADMLHLVESGLFRDPIGQGTVGEGCGIFHLTDRAIKILKELLGAENAIMAARKKRKKVKDGNNLGRPS